MSGRPKTGGRGFVASALAATSEWLVEPALPTTESPRARTPDRAAIVIVGLGQGSGATTIARALGTELAMRDPSGACAVTAAAASVLPLGTPAAGRLARALGAFGATRACGRLCLVDAPNRVALADAALSMAPLVFDVAHSEQAASAAALAHRVVLVGGPRVEPALASAMAASLARVGPTPLVVANRPREESGWAARANITIPHSTLGARWALAGREARGELGVAVGALADLLESTPVS